jgi:NAD(P)-dependent dehydrogenase (short-subunit alcohol dehydrogenase family)
MGRLDGKTAIITGATSGIGRAAAHRFVEEGARVVFNGLGADAGREVETALREKGGEALYVDADLEDLSAIDRLVRAALDTFGTIDVLYGNAGMAANYDFHQLDMALEYDRLMNVNLRANVYLTRQVLPTMMERRAGNCVYTISLAAEDGLPRNAIYSAAKAGMKNMVKSLAMEYGEYGIRFNGILPGSTYTGMVNRGGETEKLFMPTIPMKRYAEPWEIANAAVFFASDEVPFCTGAMLTVDGGQGCGVMIDGGMRD